LDGRSFPAGAKLDFRIHIFDPALAGAFAGIPMISREMELAPVANPVPRVKVRFLTPTELKNAPRPDFGALFARLRDRISTLAGFYQSRQLDIDFRAMGQRADRVRMTRCEIEDVDRERKSGRTGQVHSIGGFVGEAEYEGDLAEFIPFLEAGKWTGVGRQTVWGKGEIDTDY
jgi:hypothetical protein